MVSNACSNHRAARALIDVSAYRHNLTRVRHYASNARVMAVIKANGYGHGMEVAARALQEADEFAVTGLDDAERLRAAGIDKTLTVLSARYDAAELNTFSARGIRPVFYESSQLTLLDGITQRADLDLWVKLDTGMGRLGFDLESVGSVLERVKSAPGVRSISLMTHLANADNPGHPNNRNQFERLSNVIGLCSFKEVSVLNSAGTVAFADQAFDTVRPGLMLYGISPQQGSSADRFNLQPVMSFNGELISIRTMAAGSAISYGSTYVLQNDTRVGVVSVGYGDGYPRHAPSGTPVVINESIAPLIGRVSMDMISVDLATIPAQIGDQAELWGVQNPIENIAELAGTIAYELTCGITDRVERITI